jgi:hypothetical protein
MKSEHNLIKPEPLIKALRTYLERRAPMPMLRHPLVYRVPYFDIEAGLVNAQYLEKLRRIKELEACADFSTIVWMYERPYRLEALIRYAIRMPDAEFWALSAQVWCDTENADECWESWQALMLADRPGREAMMSEMKQNFLASLTESAIRI